MFSQACCIMCVSTVRTPLSVFIVNRRNVDIDKKTPLWRSTTAEQIAVPGWLLHLPALSLLSKWKDSCWNYEVVSLLGSEIDSLKVSYKSKFNLLSTNMYYVPPTNHIKRIIQRINQKAPPALPRAPQSQTRSRFPPSRETAQSHTRAEGQVAWNIWHIVHFPGVGWFAYLLPFCVFINYYSSWKALQWDRVWQCNALGWSAASCGKEGCYIFHVLI